MKDAIPTMSTKEPLLPAAPLKNIFWIGPSDERLFRRREK
jgi:hypothetical protein